MTYSFLLIIVFIETLSIKLLYLSIFIFLIIHSRYDDVFYLGHCISRIILKTHVDDFFHFNRDFIPFELIKSNRRCQFLATNRNQEAFCLSSEKTRSSQDPHSKVPPELAEEAAMSQIE